MGCMNPSLLWPCASTGWIGGASAQCTDMLLGWLAAPPDHATETLQILYQLACTLVAHSETTLLLGAGRPSLQFYENCESWFWFGRGPLPSISVQVSSMHLFLSKILGYNS